MAEEKVNVKKPFKGAKVDWPADMPDDMLEDAITVAKKALDEHDFEEQGVEVSDINNFDKFWVDCKHCKETYGREMGTLLACFLG